MAVSFKVTISEMQNASDRISNAADDFEQTADQVLQCAAALGNCWEGDSQVAFIDEQEKAHEWYTKMMKLARDYVQLLRDAAERYQDADNDGASIIRSN